MARAYIEQAQAELAAALEALGSPYDVTPDDAIREALHNLLCAHRAVERARETGREALR